MPGSGATGPLPVTSVPWSTKRGSGAQPEVDARHRWSTRPSPDAVELRLTCATPSSSIAHRSWLTRAAPDPMGDAVDRPLGGVDRLRDTVYSTVDRCCRPSRHATRERCPCVRTLRQPLGAKPHLVSVRAAGHARRRARRRATCACIVSSPVSVHEHVGVVVEVAGERRRRPGSRARRAWRPACPGSSRARANSASCSARRRRGDGLGAGRAVGDHLGEQRVVVG